MNREQLFLGRQPILDRSEKIIGFELLFRSADCLSANVTDYFQASSSVIFTTISDFGIEEVLGPHKGFFNVDAGVLMSEMLELLPRGQVVIELLENIEITPEIIERCGELKRKGFSLALDDHLYAPAFVPLYEIVDIIKLDLLAIPPESLAETVRVFRRWPLQLLAEKVETIEQHQQCLELGFELFQGYYFARPSVIMQNRVDIANLTLMQLLDQVMRDAEIKTIEESFKQNPKLIYNLLRLVNSVALGMREKITALRHAITVLGREQLKRWIMLALYSCSEQHGAGSPLMELATTRGKLMELLAQKQHVTATVKDYPDRAFMTGVLSLVNVLFNVPIEEVVEHCNLTDDVRQALLKREGELGLLLSLTEHLERSDFVSLSAMAPKVRLTFEQIQDAHLAAIKWANRLNYGDQGKV